MKCQEKGKQNLLIKRGGKDKKRGGENRKSAVKKMSKNKNLFAFAI